MIDYRLRIDELCTYLAQTFQIVDRQAIEILLASFLDLPQLPSPKVPKPWIVLETDWWNLSATGAWFEFGGAIRARSCSELRRVRPRTGQLLIEEWTAHAEEKNLPIFLTEPRWKLPARAHSKFRDLPYFLSNCIRLRTKHPRGPANLSINMQQDMNKAARLRQFTEDVIDETFRFKEVPSEVRFPEGFLYYCELLHRMIDPLICSSWEDLTNNLLRIALRRARLYNRTQPDDEDWAAVARVISDMVPYWTRLMVESIDENEQEEHSIIYTSWQVARDSDIDRRFVKKELDRLRKVGVLRVHTRGKIMWSTQSPDYAKVARGHIFG